jgi:hypothetical protein
MKTYEGVAHPGTPYPSDANAAGHWMVVRDGQMLKIAPSQKLWKHSEGFSWGYPGSGPAQLALALLLDALGDKQRALRLHQRFKSSVVARWPKDEGWTITEDEIKKICDRLDDERD